MNSPAGFKFLLRGHLAAIPRIVKYWQLRLSHLSILREYSPVLVTIRHYSGLLNELFVTIRYYSPLFVTIRDYSPLFATIRHYSSLFATIRDYSYYSLFATIRHSLFGFSRHPSTIRRPNFAMYGLLKIDRRSRIDFTDLYLRN